MHALLDVSVLAATLLVVACVLVVLRARQRSPAVRAGLMLGALALAWLPFAELSLAAYVVSITSGLSATSLVLLGALVASHGLNRPVCTRHQVDLTLLLVLAGGLVLYPASLGHVNLDTWSWGLGSPPLPAALFLLSLFLWWKRRTLPLLCVLAAVSGLLLAAYESRNLWDYLIDPLVTLFAVQHVVARAAAPLFAARRNLGARA
jgi:hypothetical protein